MISTPWPWTSLRSACHPGRSKRQPQYGAQEASTTFFPRNDDRRDVFAREHVGQGQLGCFGGGERTPTKTLGPIDHSPASASATMAMPSRSAVATRLNPAPADRSSGTHTSPLHAPSGLICQPVASFESSQHRYRVGPRSSRQPTRDPNAGSRPVNRNSSAPEGGHLWSAPAAIDGRWQRALQRQRRLRGRCCRRLDCFRRRVSALSDLDLARLGLLRDRDAHGQYAVVQVSLEVLEIEPVAELNLAAEGTR